jgi:hypothetical protein
MRDRLLGIVDYESIDCFHHVATIRFPHEVAIVGNIVLTRPQRAGGHQQQDARPPLVNLPRELYAVASWRHLNIGEQEADVGPGFKNGQSFCRIASLNHRISGVFQKLSGMHPKKLFIINDKNHTVPLAAVVHEGETDPPPISCTGLFE